MTTPQIQALCLMPGYVLFLIWLVREVRYHIALCRLEKAKGGNLREAADYDAHHAERWEYERWINEQL